MDAHPVLIEPHRPNGCPTCGCALHAAARTWRTRCSDCGEDRWPYHVDAPPEPYICERCRTASPVKRAAAKKAAQYSVAKRRQRWRSTLISAPQAQVDGPGDTQVAPPPQPGAPGAQD